MHTVPVYLFNVLRADCECNMRDV